MSINSKQKGSGFELKVAKMLSEWSGQEFHRTPMSGALHWSNDKRVVSDIVPPQELTNWPFSIECKKVEYSWEFNTIMSGTSTFWSHWKQAEDDAERENMVPMLVFSKNRRDIYVAMNTHDYEKLVGKEISATLYIKKETKNISIILFKELLENVSLGEVLKI